MCTLVRCLFLAAIAVTAFGHSLGPQDVVFHLFTRSNPTQSQVMFPTVSSIMISNFAPDQRTIFTIHGHGDFANFNAFVVPSHLEAEAVNVVAVDWTVGSNTYTEGVSQANQVGLMLSQFINLLSSQFSYPPSMVTIVGLGLGCHVGAIAGRLVTGTVPHLVAIDPSLHGWTHHPGRLGTDAAAIVEVLHTTAGFLGYDDPLGHIDFYPNGGSFQNGCGMDISCSHIFGVAFYAESIVAANRGYENFVGTACENYQEAISMNCAGANDVIFGGIEVKTSGSGIYTFADERKMRCAIVFCVLIFLVNYSFEKEDVVYELQGGDLFDLIRGRPPKGGKLKVKKVTGDAGVEHPDGIYFIPEDILSEVPDELEVKRKQPQGH